MTDFNNNQSNQDNSRDNNINNNQGQPNKAPEYSFWAEQTPGTNYAYRNQGNPNIYQNQGGYNNYQNQDNNSWQYSNTTQNMNQMNHEFEPKKKKTGRKIMKFVAMSLCFGLIAGAAFFGIQKVSGDIFGGTPTVFSVADKADKVGYTKTAAVQLQDQTAVTKVANNTMPAIVSINCSSTQTSQDWFGQSYSQDVQSSGSGIIVGKTAKELLIATNNHVVEGSNKTYVTFIDGTKAEAKIKGTDSTADLAVVSVDITKLSDDTMKAISIAKLGDSNAVKVGQIAVAIGNALGYGQSLTVGYISAKDRVVDVSDGYNQKKMTFLQTDAAINPGNSGGALLNINGEVIGINTVKYASDEVEGMGYAIPISTATPIINELMSREVLTAKEQGYMGISGFDVTDAASTTYNIPVGVFIKEVAKGAALDKAGLKSEDVITKVNDTQITSIQQLQEYVHSRKVGTVVKVTYMRNSDGKYKELTVNVTLGQNPNLTDDAN